MKAFPISDKHYFEGEEEAKGMDLRDYFAAKAMQGLLASGHTGLAHEISRQAYVMADAMMEARK